MSWGRCTMFTCCCCCWLNSGCHQHARTQASIRNAICVVSNEYFVLLITYHWPTCWDCCHTSTLLFTTQHTQSVRLLRVRACVRTCVRFQFQRNRAPHARGFNVPSARMRVLAVYVRDFQRVARCASPRLSEPPNDS